MKAKHGRRRSLQKRAQRGFRGYPIATVAYYGPNDKHATKVAVGIVKDESGEVAELRRWFSDHGDIRTDQEINQEILQFIDSQSPRSVVIADRIMGCPHSARTLSTSRVSANWSAGSMMWNWDRLTSWR